jgi:DNA damage-binding protein 1
MASLPYLYVATSQPPSAVTWTAVGNFSSATDVNLIVAKVSRIEISLITSPTIAEDGSLVGGGVTPLFEVPVNGRVASLQLLRLKVSLQMAGKAPSP